MPDTNAAYEPPSQSTGLLCWVCKDDDEALRVIRKFKSVEDCMKLMKTPDRQLMLTSLYGKLPKQPMAYRIVRSAGGKVVVHSADLVFVSDYQTWNNIYVFSSTKMYAENRDDENMIARLAWIKQLEKSVERSTKAFCPLCLEGFLGVVEARAHLFAKCLTTLAEMTDGPVIF